MSTLDGTTAASSTTAHSDWIADPETAVNDIIETLIDGVRGFEAAAAKADSPVQQQLMAMGAQRRKTAGDIIRIATDENMAPITLDEDGTTAAALHRSWLSLREAVQGDAGVAAAALSGEQHAMRKLEESLGAGLPKPVTKITQRALKEAEANISRLEAIAS